jgi:coenzyme PQQ biosynthesis protein PqqD
VISLDTRIRLAPKARLRFDARSGKHVLLYPERGLELTDTAARIATLCAEGRTAEEIVSAMVAAAVDASRERIEPEVLAFLRALEDRGLLLIDGKIDGKADGAS